MDIAKSRNFLLRENTEPLDEMAKITGALKDAIESVITANPDLNGLPLKKVIRSDKTVLDALAGDDLYDNQLNKFIASAKGERTTQQRGRATTPASAKNDIADELDIPVQSLSKSLQEPGFEEEDEEIIDTWNDTEEEEEEQGPTSKDIDTSITKDIPTDVNQANTYKNIIVKKVQKIEALPSQERASSLDMSALKQFIQKPEVSKTLGVQTIRDLVSPIIG